VLVAPGEYEISNLLRGRLGSRHAMAAPHPAGARVVVLDQRLARFEMRSHEWGEPLAVLAPPAGAFAGDGRQAVQTLSLPRAAGRPWAPAHLSARRLAGGDVAVSWVRCARIGGDSWGAGEPPLGPEGELYRIEVQDGAGTVRAVEAGASSWIYDAAAQTADFGGLPGALTLSVAQIDANGRPGLNTRLTITL